jgi:hypothetical protein
MSQTLTDIYNENLDTEYQVKLAAVGEAYEDDEVRLVLLDTAVDLVKEAQAAGSLRDDLHAGDILTLAVQLVEDEMQKLAEAEDSEEAVETEVDDTLLAKEAAAQTMEMGEVVGAILAEQGVTVDDLEKLASAEEVEELGRYCAHAYVDYLTQLSEG